MWLNDHFLVFFFSLILIRNGKQIWLSFWQIKLSAHNVFFFHKIYMWTILIYRPLKWGPCFSCSPFFQILLFQTHNYIRKVYFRLFSAHKFRTILNQTSKWHNSSGIISLRELAKQTVYFFIRSYNTIELWNIYTRRAWFTTYTFLLFFSCRSLIYKRKQTHFHMFHNFICSKRIEIHSCLLCAC